MPSVYYDEEKRKKYGEKLRQMLREIRNFRNEVDSPAIESSLREMEYAAYQALMYVGMEEGCSPETWDESA